MEMTWNQDGESIIAAAELGDAPAKTAVALLVDARKRAFDAEQKAQQLQDELDALKAAHAWIKTSDNTPDLHQMVLGFDQNGDVELVRYLGINRWKYAVLSRSEPLITHWMPLPEAPK